MLVASVVWYRLERLVRNCEVWLMCGLLVVLMRKRRPRRVEVIAVVVGDGIVSEEEKVR